MSAFAKSVASTISPNRRFGGNTLQSAFARQQRTAKWLTLSPMNRKFYKEAKLTNLNYAIKTKNYDHVLKNFARTGEMNYLQDKAYSRKSGYAIGYVKGKKVMFVSGSRNTTDWVFNTVDEFLPGKYQVVSNRTAKRLTKIAKDNNVDVVVGHSRGAHLVAKMDVPKDKKLGLDGALRLAPKGKRDMMNLYQKQALDRVIAKRGSNRKGYRLKRLKHAHFITRDYKGYKGPQYSVSYKKRKYTDYKRYIPGMRKRAVYKDYRYT